mmetsp:Transcript_24096/g.50844  ORF Transcript_24096/g.50844 Transcript_24096/m.50844 type:complete len:214 (-) Transcript_24096:127-768(-)
MHAITANIGDRIANDTPQTTITTSRTVMQGWQHPPEQTREETRTIILKKCTNKLKTMPAITKTTFVRVIMPCPKILPLSLSSSSAVATLPLTSSSSSTPVGKDDSNPRVPRVARMLRTGITKTSTESTISSSAGMHLAKISPAVSSASRRMDHQDARILSIVSPMWSRFGFHISTNPRSKSVKKGEIPAFPETVRDRAEEEMYSKTVMIEIGY